MAKTPNQKAWDAEIKRIMRELQNTGNAPKLSKYIPKKPPKVTQADLAKLRKITPSNIKGIKFGAEPETGEPKTFGKKSEPPRRIRRTSTDSEIPKGRTYTPHLRVKGAGGSGGGRKKQTKPPKPPLTPEEKRRIRSEAGKRRWQNMSQEAKDAAIRRMREGARKRRESMTSEEREAERQRRSKQSKEAWGRKSEAEKEAIKARLREAAQKHREEQASKEKTPEEQGEEPGSPATPEPAPEPSPEQPSPEYVAPYAAVEDEYIQNYLFDFNRGLGVYDEYIRHLLQYVQREGGDVTKLFDILERLRWDGKLAERVQHGYLSEHTLTEMKNVVSALKNEGIDIGLDEDDLEELYEREVGIAEAYERVGLSYHSVIKRFADAQRRKRRDE